MNGHPYKLMKMDVEVDVDIIPIVQWLLSWDGVRTLYSCQGDDEQGQESEAYVLFVCNSEDSLKRILERKTLWDRSLDNFSNNNRPVEVECENDRIRYRMAWTCKKDMVAFGNFLQGRA
jgi:hypothetical protein